MAIAWSFWTAAAFAQDANEALDELLAETEDIVDVDMEALLSIEVESASKRSQSAMEAPAAVSVLTADDIAAVAADNNAELLRRVPGVFVLQPSANAFNVGARGLNGLANNNLLTLLDARNVADPSLGFVPWGLMPIHPGDIERIELLHGPGSTLYGANAVSGVVNIRTKRPIDHPGLEAAAHSGLFTVEPQGAARARMHNGGSGYAAYGWVNADETLGLRGSVGFNAIPGWDDPEIGVRTLPGLEGAGPSSISPRHGPFNAHGLLSAEHRFGPHGLLFGTLSWAEAEPEFILGGVANPIPVAQSELAFTSNATVEELAGGLLRLQVGVDGSRYRLAIPELPGGAAQDVATQRVHAVAQADVHLWNDRNVTSVAVEGTVQRTEDFFDVSPGGRYGAFVVANELRMLERPALLLSGGVRFEAISSDDGGGNEIEYRNANPRGALVLSFEDRHSLRLAVATAYRTPTPFENFATRRLAIFDEPVPEVPFLVPNRQIRPTEARSLELGYQVRPDGTLHADVATYYQEIRDVVGLLPVAQLPLRFDNIGSFTQLGATVSLTHSPDDWFTYRAGYAFLYSREDGASRESRLWPRHLANAGVDVRVPGRVRLTVDFAAAAPVETREFVILGDSLRVVDDETAWQLTLDTRVSRDFADGLGEVFVAGRNLLSLVRDGEDLLQHTVVGVEPIGASVIVGVAARGL